MLKAKHTTVYNLRHYVLQNRIFLKGIFLYFCLTLMSSVPFVGSLYKRISTFSSKAFVTSVVTAFCVDILLTIYQHRSNIWVSIAGKYSSGLSVDDLYEDDSAAVSTVSRYHLPIHLIM